MRVGIIAGWLNPCLTQAIDLMRAMDVLVDVIRPDAECTALDRIRVEHDVYVLKSGSDAAMGIAGALHLSGARLLNPFPVVALMRNKATVTAALMSAGIPVPATVMTRNAFDLASELARGPVIVKPPLGTKGRGVRIVRDAAQLSQLPPRVPLLGQRYQPPDGPDHKIYRIGERVFGVRRPWPIVDYRDKVGEPFEPSYELHDITVRCGEVFGTALYGLDIVVSHGKPFVVDMNKFGSFMGVPEAPRLLADYIVASAR